jgi:hypothetical protein
MSFEKKAVSQRPPHIASAEAMLDTILELGIVPFFVNVIPGYSIEEMTAPENWFDTQENLTYTPWDWKIPCVQSGEIAYGKFLLGGKAAFATVEWYRELRNYRQAQEKYRPDTAQKQILDYLKENGSISIKEIRGLLGIKKGQADALVTRLMMQCRVITGDIIRVYRGEDLHYNGWQTSSFCTPEALFDTGTPFAGFPGFPFQEDAGLEVKHSPEESYRLLQQKIRSLVPEATDKQIAKLLA